MMTELRLEELSRGLETVTEILEYLKKQKWEISDMFCISFIVKLRLMETDAEILNIKL